MTQGQGGTTEHKERFIQAALTINMRGCGDVTRQVSRFPYWHLDLNSGSGWNTLAGCIGTPLAFLSAAKDAGTPNFKAFFCDRDSDAISTLRLIPEISTDPRCQIIHADNSAGLSIMAERIRAAETSRYALGSIVSDPNGWFYGDQVPVEPLYEFAREFPRIDMVLNLNVRTRQMMKSHMESGKWGGRTCLTTTEIPKFLNRKHWLIRDVVSAGDRFVIMIGRNHPFKEHRGPGFHDLRSKTGDQIAEAIEGRKPPVRMPQFLEWRNLDDGLPGWIRMSQEHGGKNEN